MRKLPVCVAAVAALWLAAGCSTAAPAAPVTVTESVPTTVATTVSSTQTVTAASKVPDACVRAFAIANDILDAWVNAGIHYEAAITNAVESDGGNFTALLDQAKASRKDALGLVDSYSAAGTECISSSR